MDGKELQAIWRSGTPSFGAWVTMTDPTVAAVICNIGYEWLIIDTEHNPYNPETLREIIAVVRARNCVPIVRVPSNNSASIKQTLDFGAEGVVVPLLHTAADAQEAVAACRYPPYGIRGFNPRDASNFFKDTQYYLETINDRVVVILQVEHIDAVNNLDGILATPGIGGIFNWTSRSFIFNGTSSANRPPRCAGCDPKRQFQNVMLQAFRLGLPWIGTPEDLASWMRSGLNFLPLGFDYDWIMQGGKAILNQMRTLTGGR